MDQVQVINASDFRTFLEQELCRRNSLNPNYSLRAFARDLGVDSSFLSKLLNGKRAMTVRTILSLAPRLGMDDALVKDYIQKANGRRRRYLGRDSGEIEFEPLDNPKLAEVLEWYHLAILELVGVSDFEPQAAWIAERLSIPSEQAEKALKELTEQGVLVQGENGKWKSELTKHSLCSKKFPRLQEVKKSFYEKAVSALNQGMGDHHALTLSVSESRYQEALEKITRFSRELCHFLQEPEEKEKVFQILVSIFPISK